MRASRRVAGALTCVALAAGVTAAGGCGGGGRTQRGKADRGRERGEESERASQLKRIPAADRVAFFQLAITIGLLRERAYAASRGLPARPRLDADLAAARARVAALRPKDARLAGVQSQLAAALRARPARGADRRAGRASLARTTALLAALRSYTRTRPEYQALVPD